MKGCIFLRVPIKKRMRVCSMLGCKLGFLVQFKLFFLVAICVVPSVGGGGRGAREGELVV